MINFESYSDTLSRLFPLEFSNGNKKTVDVTFQVTDNCNLRCTYCYQSEKQTHKMDFQTGKKLVDSLLDPTTKNIYFDASKIGGFTFNFIGGEPLLNMPLIEELTEYIIHKMIIENNPLIYRTRFSICSNGTLFFSPAFQSYLKKYGHWLSLSISIDGDKNLHDSCRVFPDGSGSYEMAIKAAKVYKKMFGELPSTKITLSTANIDKLYEATVSLIKMGYRDLTGNVVFEPGWNDYYAKIYYQQLSKLGNYILDNNYEEDLSVSFFSENHIFIPLDWEKPDDRKNWCGGNGDMIAINYTGNIYPCLRYMEDALGDAVPPIIVGNVTKGFAYTEEQKKIIKELKSIDTYTQSSDECRNCPIAAGCAFCQAFNYQDSGCLNHRATYICPMHKARCLANIEFWNKYYKKHHIDKTFPNYMKPEWIKILKE